MLGLHVVAVFCFQKWELELRGSRGFRVHASPLVDVSMSVTVKVVCFSVHVV